MVLSETRGLQLSWVMRGRAAATAVEIFPAELLVLDHYKGA
jgi:hypothetical protein